MKKIAITGGHAGTTAIATIEAFEKSGKKLSISWIGPRYAFEGSKDLSLEFKVMPEMGVRCYPIVSGKIQSKFTRHTIRAALRVPVGFAHALWLLLKIRPDVVLSFGGFAGVPVVFAAWLVRIPVVIHEQIAAAGLGNRLSAPLASRIAVAREDSLKFFSSKKTKVTGNPILENIARIEPKNKISNPPVIYFTGGSRGSRVLNDVVAEVLPELTKKYFVIHQTGEVDRERFEKIKGDRYESFGFVNPMEIYKIYERADLVVGRAGANTVSQVLAAGRPAIYVPIPWSRFDEQSKNAKYAQRMGMARIIVQRELSGERLLGEIERALSEWGEMSRQSRTSAATFDERAAMELSKIVLDCAK